MIATRLQNGAFEEAPFCIPDLIMPMYGPALSGNARPKHGTWAGYPGFDPINDIELQSTSRNTSFLSRS